MQPFQLPDFYVPWPARLNPNLEAARAHSKTWAQEMGILDAHQDENTPNIWSEQAFDRHDYALFCAYVHPEAPGPELDLMTDWNVWAFYVDDYFLKVYKQPKDRAGGKKYLDRVLLFMPVDLNPLPAPTNPMERGLADLWLRTAPAKSEAWRCRITESMRALLAAFFWELDCMSQQRLANPMEYIEMRRQVGAALWSADLVEHAMFVEIPERIASTRPIRVLKNTFADGVHLRNDIFSYEREVLREGELTNAVLVIERFMSVDTQRAANLVNDLLTARLQQFEHTVLTELAPLFEEYRLDPIEQANVLTYIRGLQDWQSGAHEWHIQTSRYLNPSLEPAPTTQGFLPGLPGLGASAARITPGALALGLNRFKSYMHVPYQKVGPTQLPEFYMPFTPRINPHFETASRHSKAFARRMGMLDALPGHPDVCVWDEHRFDVNDLSLFNAFCVPNATAAELNLDACWMVWGTYTDDYFAQVYGHTHNMAGAKIFYTRLLEFMPLDAAPASIALTPTERGLAELWQLTTATLSVEERSFFRKVIEDMIGGWLWELSNRIQNRIPNLIDYIEIRHKISGSDFTLVLPGSVQGQGIPPEVYQTSTMQELHNAAIDYVWLTNDIFSYQMEIEFEGDIHNGVLIIQNFLGCDKMQAVEIANNLMTARMEQFEHLITTDLPVLFEDFDLNDKARELLLAYVEDRKQFMSGSLQWHIKTGRYKEIELLRHSAWSRLFTGIPTGLGTTAAHVLKPVAGEELGEVAMQPATPCPAQAKDTYSETQIAAKTFAVSHLLPFRNRKEEVQEG